MRKLMFVLGMMLLAHFAKAEEFGFISLEVKSGSTVGEVFFAHPEVQNLGFPVYSKDYKEAWEKVNGPTDFNKLRPGFYNFPVTKIIVQEAQAVDVPTSLPAIEPVIIEPVTAEGVENEPESVEQEVVAPRQYQPSGLIEFNFEQYPQIEWTPAPQRAEPASALENSVSAQVSAQIAAHTELVQAVEVQIPVQKPETFTISEKEKIADQNQAAYKRLNKRSYPRESFLMKNLPYLLLGLLGSALIILSIILARWLWPRLPEFIDHFRARGASPREVELEAQVVQLEKELKTYKEHLFIFNYPGLKRRSDLNPLKELLLKVKGKTEEGIALVFVPGVDELVPARPLIVEGALRRAQEVLGEKCLYILPEPVARGRKNPENKPNKKPDLRILKKPVAHAAASQ